MALLVAEVSTKRLNVEPSQGTHFFQNLTSCNVGYFTVNPEAGDGIIDWDWLNGIEPVSETNYIRHVRLKEPLEVLVDGRIGKAVVLTGERND